MSRKMTSEEIRLAGEAIRAIQREEGKRAAREAADRLQVSMMANGNTDEDSKWHFEKHTGWSWRK